MKKLHNRIQNIYTKSINEDVELLADIDSDNINAISFAYYLYDFIKAQKFMKNGEDLPLLTWNEGNDSHNNMQIQAFSDPQIKVILAGVKGNYR